MKKYQWMVILCNQHDLISYFAGLLGARLTYVTGDEFMESRTAWFDWVNILLP